MKHLRWATLWATLVLPGLASGQASQKAAVNVARLVDSITTRVQQHYVFPDKARPISTALAAQAKKKAYTALATKPQELAQKLQADIYRAHRDPHLVVEYNPGFARRTQGPQEPSAAESLESKNYAKAHNYLFTKAELLPGNIGYISCTGFVEHIEEAKPIIASALGFVANARALIIDLRENRGGEPAMVSQLESYFFAAKTRMNAVVSRANQDTTAYYADPAKTNGLTLAMPVYILTSHKSFSAAEDFSYAMQQAKRATVVGEVTGGGAHPTRPFSVGQGFVVHIPFARSLNPLTHTDWEGTGGIPDVAVDAARALVQAEELEFRRRHAAAQTDQEKHQLEYLINALHVHGDLGTRPVGEFDKFAGTYGPLVIYRDGTKLFCRFADNVTELAHISHNLFVLDGNAQIEFVKDGHGTYSMARLFVQNGGVFEEVRK